VAGEDVRVYIYDLNTEEIVTSLATSGYGGRFIAVDNGNVVYQSDPRNIATAHAPSLPP